ncbi:histone PARylation factor 1-like [Musca vetustissima]|uniref:histone PARylation factor 1-like n=1 Tax=Musca vetustissima TaxID=27455 RepID=UPI002AB6575E|nr:histone PARylation factor 1-like [Musca vetustissima]
MPKEDCKYWDKCYQRNELHLQKYNHPEKKASDTTKEEADDKSPKKKTITKRRSSEMETSNHTESKDNSDNKPQQEEKDKYEIEELRKEALANISGKDYMALLQKRIKLSEQQEYDNLLKSHEFIRHKFLVEMPPDFYAFWKFLEQLKPNLKGEEILKYLENQFQLLAVGPFEFLAGRFNQAKLHEPGDYLRHWRFYYDPPEFQTVFVRKGTGIHYGYWRDDPHDKESLLMARNDSTKSCEFEFIAANVFDAFVYYLDKDFQGTPFTTGTVASTKKSLQKFIGSCEVQLDPLDKIRRARSSKVVCKTFHRAGIVVPYESKTQLGYRPLIESDAELKRILKLFDSAGSNADDKNDEVKAAVMEKLQPIATAASIAVDECDFGTALELGIDLFCSGYTQLHMLISSLLVQAYSLLQRPQFIAISKAHLEQRSKGLNLSIFDLEK